MIFCKSKKSFLALSIIISCIQLQSSFITAAASSNSNAIELMLTADLSSQSDDKSATINKLEKIDVKSDPKSTKEVPAVSGHLSLRYKTIGRLFQEHKDGKLSFDDLFAIAKSQNSLAQLASFVHFALNEDIRLHKASDFVISLEETMSPYEQMLIPRISLLEYLAYNKTFKSRSPTHLNLDDSRLTTLDYIEAVPNIKIMDRLTADDNFLAALPDSLCNLTQLKGLHIYGNNLNFLPESIGNLKLLEMLNLANNKLTVLPESIGNLEHLRWLDLSSNSLSTLPSSIGQLRQLNLLNVTHNKLTNLPISLGHLTELKELRLGNNQLTFLPETFGNLIQIVVLVLDNNELTALPDSIVNFTKVENLYLRNNPFSIAEILRIQQIINYATGSKRSTYWGKTI